MRILAIILSFIGALLTGFGFFSLWIYFSKVAFNLNHIIYALTEEPYHYSWEFGVIVIFTGGVLLLRK
jgi:hypothetical protein